jgi:ankyrin repeat protein
MFTALNGHAHVARELIKAGANLEAQISSGHTALRIAAQNGHDLCARELMGAGERKDPVSRANE